ncbi:L-ribulose-5-phosphate 3-epimerase [Aerococcaceae bacterium DSM 111020]|nr:L-ribulose-5-phosphate 3-epimerase [Aerococcaceae bacterium DSM 111020]
MTALGIYEKALPKDITWPERLKLAKQLGFDFVEMSVDETDERLARLDWTNEEIKSVHDAILESGVGIYSMCLSGHRRFPFGSQDSDIRKTALKMMEKAIDLASKLGIRNIQLAGYDVYYETKTDLSREFFVENLKKSVAMAAKKQVMLSIEIMDDPFINSIEKYLEIRQQVNSPWLSVYPDLGNLSAWPENNIGLELEKGINEIAAIHLKDTRNVTKDYEGQFKNVPWGEGDVDFLAGLKTLKRLGYEGTFLLEMWSEVEENPSEAIKDALSFIQPIMKEAGYD